MKIHFENQVWDYNTGLKVLKSFRTEPPFEELKDIWDDIVPITFQEICKLTNLEQRRIALVHFGIERLVKEIDPELVKTETIQKETKWVNSEGELVSHKYEDTYELFKVDGRNLSKGINRPAEDCYYVRFKDTSTDRMYMIWVDIQSVYVTNNENTGWIPTEEVMESINPIQCISWTITTNVQLGMVDEIIRQGDCILIKPKEGNEPLKEMRHLTEREYRNLMVYES